MNKELIKKYPEAFKYWLDGGTIKIKIKGCNGWSMAGTAAFVWSSPNNILSIVKNDKFAEFRMAQVDGETIQYKTKYCDWIDYPSNKFTERNVDGYFYQIKPKVAKFKLGDLVVYQLEGIPVYAEGYHLVEPFIGKLMAWTPIIGKYYWFSNLNPKDSRVTLGKLKEIRKSKDFLPKDTYITYDGGNFHQCEPFFGELPKSLQ